MSESSSQDNQWHAYGVLLVAPLFFSSNLVIGRAAADTVEPATLAFFRWFCAFLIILPFVARPLWRYRDALANEWRILSILAFLGMVICGAVVYIALDWTTATNATLIYTTPPVMIVLLEAVFRGHRPTIAQMFGIVLAFTGVLIIIAKGDFNRIAQLQFNLGDVWILFCAVAWAVYSVLIKRQAISKLPTLVTFAAIAAVGAMMLAPLALAETIFTGSFPDTKDAWLSIAGVAFVSSVLAFSAFQYGIKIVGPATTGMFMYLLPVYGVMLAVIFLNEQVQLFHFAGFVCVAAGLVLSTLPGMIPSRR